MRLNSMDLYVIGWQLIDLQTILYIFVGTLIGTVVGALPGLSAMMAVSVLVPVTYGMTPAGGILMLLGIYCGANYGGSISACLINVPGTPSAVMTSLDGYPLSQKGKPGLAIGMSALTSTVAGLFSVITLALFAPPLAEMALKFKSLELVGVALFGLSVIAYISPGSTLKGVLAGLFGLLIATMGFDPSTAQARYTFGSMEMLAGIDFISAMIGLFGMSEMLANAEVGKNYNKTTKLLNIGIKSTFECLRYLKSYKWWMVMMRSSIIGVIVGAIPGSGGTVAAIVSYGVEKRLAKDPSRFGRGAIEGIAAPEAANNSCTGGAMTPLLALGIPGDSVTAILIGAFIVHGLVPGPMLYVTNPEIVSAIYIGLVISNIMMLIIGLFGSHHISKLLLIPVPILNGIILTLCVLGTFSIKNSLFDSMCMFIFGVLGYIMMKAKIPRAPIVLGMILGPMMEENLRRWADIADGQYLSLFVQTLMTNPVTSVMLAATAFILVAPIFSKKKYFAEDDIDKFVVTDGDESSFNELLEIK